MVGVALIAIGGAWSLALPLNKPLWTGSYIVFTAGIAAVLIAILTAAVDGERRSFWVRPLIVFGENPLIAYAGSEIARRILHSSIKVKGPSGRLGLDEWVSTALAHTGWSPNAASLAWAILFLAAWWLVLERLSRRGLLVRA